MYAPNLTDDELAAAVRDLCNEVATQDNRATSFPMFTVQEKETIDGVDPEYYSNSVHAYVEDGDVVVPQDGEEADRWSVCDYGDREIEEVYSIERWRDIAYFFTQKAADKYITRQAHNHGKLRVYVASGHRNDEWQVVHEYLRRKGEESAASPWRSLESAPKDGTEVLLVRYDLRFVAHFDVHERRWIGGPCPYSEDDPHLRCWMPLEAVPS